jgi:hypothetical protein
MLPTIPCSMSLRAAIAIIRLNATDKSNYKGPVFINPGILHFFGIEFHIANKIRWPRGFGHLVCEAPWSLLSNCSWAKSCE